MTIKVIASNDILAKLDPMRTAIVMTDTAPERLKGDRAGGHVIGAGGIGDIKHMEGKTFGEMRTAGVIQFETEVQLAKAVRAFAITPGQNWYGEGLHTGSREMRGEGDLKAAGKAFVEIASAEGAHVLYDGGLAASTRDKGPTVRAWVYEHDGMVHERDHPASIKMEFREDLSREPWSAKRIDIDVNKAPRRGDMMELASDKTGETYWAVLDAATLKAVNEARAPKMAIIASRQDVSDAIAILSDREGSVTPTGRVLAGLAPAIAQAQWTKGADGRLTATGEIKSGRDALIALRDGFGKGEHRKVTLDAAKAQTLIDGMGPVFRGAHEQVMATSARRDAAYQAKRAAKPARQSGGAAR